MAGSTSTILIDKVADWLMAQALEDCELEALARGCCDRLASAGIPLARANFSFSVLHPLYHAMGFTWWRGRGLEVEGYRHAREGESERFLRSPYYHLISNGLEYMRRRLDASAPLEFPLLESLRDSGLTDYLAFSIAFRQGSGQGMLGSWATDRTNGFSEEEIAALLRIQSRLAVAARMAVQGHVTRNALSTYLGTDAGRRVLEGQIRRGDGETIRAAIVMGDMRNSTSLAEELGREAYISVLNAFFDHAASAFADSGGEILSFMGDAFLAIFPSADSPEARRAACEQAFAAALAAVQRMAEVNMARKAEGHAEIGYGLGLHIGNVMFGNVGLEDRLAFSIFGAAVNEVARLQALTKTCEVPIIASEEFRSRCDGEWQELGQHLLRGMSHPITIYTPSRIDPKALPAAIMRRVREVGRSEAENVVLLHRDRPKELAR